MKEHNFILKILIFITFLSGLCQGLLLPLLSILLEDRGVPAELTGLNASALYLGILMATPFMEGNFYRFGFKPLLIAGTFMVAVLIPLFPLIQSYNAWLGLRFSIGVFNHVFHYATVVWLTLIAPGKKRGRYLSYYGFAFGLGFSMGPLLSELRVLSVFFPFILTSVISLMSCLLVCCLSPEKVENPSNENSETTLWIRVGKILSIAWFALLPAIGYGVLEASVSGVLPIYFMRCDLSNTAISLILSCFFFSGLVTQLPIGRYSDYLGRRKTLISLNIIGVSAFLCAASAGSGLFVSILFYSIAGGALGSIYSLGVTYLTDCIPKELLPTGNMLSSICFGIGSLLGPFIGGTFIERLPGINFAWLMVIMFAALLTGLIVGKPER